MLTEDTILAELDQWRAVGVAYRQGLRGDALPPLRRRPEDDRMPLAAWLGLLLHPPLFALATIGRRAGIASFMGLAARLRVATDRLSYEPEACGLNEAFSHLGLAALSQGDITAAVEYLDASWHVHPCPHNTTFGLKPWLVRELEGYPEASDAVRRYLEMATRFVAVLHAQG